MTPHGQAAASDLNTAIHDLEAVRRGRCVACACTYLLLIAACRTLLTTSDVSHHIQLVVEFGVSSPALSPVRALPLWGKQLLSLA